MIVSILVAVARNGVIGKDNQLIWKLSDDLRNFKALTMGHCIIMGRKTYESIGKPLPGRTNIIISRNPRLEIDGCRIAGSLEEALEIAAHTQSGSEAFVIGGGEIFALAVPLADKIYLTLVYAEPAGDAFFDILPFTDWKEISRKTFSKGERNQYDFEITELEKT